MKQIILNAICNATLRKKIFLIMISSCLLIALVVSVAISFIIQQNREMLYYETADILSYSIHEIEDALNSIENFSATLISNQMVQDNMHILKSSINASTRNAAKQELYLYLQTAISQFPDNTISYISLNTAANRVDSYAPLAQNVPQEVKTEMLQTALANNGRPSIVTRYNSQYGIFLTRSIREAKNFSMENLGSILIAIDMHQLMHEAVNNSSSYNHALFALYSGTNVLYKSDNLSTAQANGLLVDFSGEYDTVTIENKPYFAVRGAISKYGWQYICLFDYSQVQNTIHISYIFALFSLALGVCLSLLLSVIMMDSISRHLDNLVYKIRNFEGTDIATPLFEYDYKKRTDELGVLHVQFDNMAQKIDQLISINYTSELLRQEAQIKALESQINPHFLYNTLESINWRAKLAGEDTISLMVESLGKMMHSALSSNDSDYTLGRELDLVNAYLTIQKIRYEDRLCYQIKSTPKLNSILVPRMIIQPLVENSVRYGIEENLDSTEIQISASNDGNDLLIVVSNTGSQFEDALLEKLNTHATQTHGFGIGLINIDERLRLKYGDAYGLTLSNSDDMAVAHIRIPIM